VTAEYLTSLAFLLIVVRPALARRRLLREL
jgi:hypothetical protein